MLSYVQLSKHFFVVICTLSKQQLLQESEKEYKNLPDNLFKIFKAVYKKFLNKTFNNFKYYLNISLLQIKTKLDFWWTDLYQKSIKVGYLCLKIKYKVLRSI